MSNEVEDILMLTSLLNSEASTSTLTNKRSREDYEVISSNNSHAPTFLKTTVEEDLMEQVEWGDDSFELEDDNNGQLLEVEEISTTNATTAPISTIKPRAKRRAVRSLDPSAVKTDKSCLRCRIRKVRCDRTFPVCSHCFGRGEECNLHLFPPKQKSKDLSGIERERLELLEERLAQLEGKSRVEEDLQAATIINTEPIILPATETPMAPLISSETYDFLTSLQQFRVPEESSNHALAQTNIGVHSLDWRLATPQMATSLSQHLCNDMYRGDLSNLSGPAKVAVSAFCAIGARPSVHSALLGIDSFSSTAKGKQPEALYMSAGTRRQNACDTLTREAHTMAFEQGLLEDATEENLGAILALVQLMMFMELEPRRSRSLIRSAVGHFKDLIDAAIDENQKMELKRTFAFAIYYADSLTSAWAKKACLIAESDLDVYFNNIGIIVPNLPSDAILPVLESLLDPIPIVEGGGGGSSGNVGGGGNAGSVTDILLSLRTAVHLLMCWTAKIQRLFTTFASTPNISGIELNSRVNALWTAIDQTRVGLQYLQAKVYASADLLSTSPHAHSHSHSHSPSSHSHETDFVARSIRSDRDLLDVVTLMHVLLTSRSEEVGIKGALYEQSTSRVRKGLRVLAFYSKLYASGADQHMIYHHVFQLEHHENWTTMAMQRLGDPGGPTCKEEEVSDIELNWFREGLHSACFFTPFPEQRLSELRSHFESMDVAIPSTPPIALSADTDLFQFNITSSSNVSSPANFANLFADGLSRSWDNDAGGLEFF